jgi:hypothetical protein
MKNKPVVPQEPLEYTKEQRRASGSRGGLKSSANMTPEQRVERAKKAIAARWAKRSETKNS